MHQKIDPHRDMGTSMNGDVIQKTVNLHQKIDTHHDMGISMNSDVVKKRVDLHQKIDRIAIWVHRYKY